jgi:hypothetical protein
MAARSRGGGGGPRRESAVRVSRLRVPGKSAQKNGRMPSLGVRVSFDRASRQIHFLVPLKVLNFLIFRKGKSISARTAERSASQEQETRAQKNTRVERFTAGLAPLSVN